MTQSREKQARQILVEMCEDGLIQIPHTDDHRYKRAAIQRLTEKIEAIIQAQPDETAAPLAVSWEYVGEELAIFWENPYGHGKEKIASFWWPKHPPEKTNEVEDYFEQIANRATVLSAYAYLKVERLPDWSYGAFLNETDASCIAIGSTEQEALESAWTELHRRATPAAGVTAERDKLLDIVKRVWKNAEINGTLPVLLLQDIEALLAAAKGGGDKT